jgi:hypothetical protein
MINLFRHPFVHLFYKTQDSAELLCNTNPEDLAFVCDIDNPRTRDAMNHKI